MYPPTTPPPSPPGGAACPPGGAAPPRPPLPLSTRRQRLGGAGGGGLARRRELGRWIRLRFAPHVSVDRSRGFSGTNHAWFITFLISFCAPHSWMWLSMVRKFGPRIASAGTPVHHAPPKSTILYEKEMRLTLSDNDVHYTACSLLVISRNSCGKLHCQKV